VRGNKSCAAVAVLRLRARVSSRDARRQPGIRPHYSKHSSSRGDCARVCADEMAIEQRAEAEKQEIYRRLRGR